ncbi:MAG: AMP-binding protein, partial [Bdellovibrionota bacterium]
ACEDGHPLVVLPPSSAREEEVLLKQLPATPPAGARLVMFTSGTTGEPKAVFQSENSLLASARQLGRAFPGSGPSVSLLPAWGMAGVMFHCIFPAVRAGSPVFSRDSALEWGPYVPPLLRTLEAEFITLNPALLEMLLLTGLDPQWRGSVVSLTAPLKPALRARISGHKLLEIFGMTEASGPVLLEGKSLGAETRITPDGELELKGPQLLLGYGANGHFSRAPEWFGTGDIFSQDGDRLSHQVRKRDLIDMGGRKISPRLIEEVLEGMPEISECLAFAVELSGLERPGLLFVRKSGCTLPANALSARLEQFMGSGLSPELRPKWWREVSALPRLKNGKPDRKAARLEWLGENQA